MNGFSLKIQLVLIGLCCVGPVAVRDALLAAQAKGLIRVLPRMGGDRAS